MGNLERPLVTSPGWSFRLRLISVAILLVLFAIQLFASNHLSVIKSQSQEQDTISAGQEKLTTKLEAKIRIFSTKIADAEKLGVDVAPAKAALTTIKKLVFADQQFTQANQLLATQTGLLDALIAQHAATQAEKAKGSVTGMVKDGTALLAGVKVSLSQNGNVIGSATTDINGIFSLSVTFGVYQLTASKSGYSTVTQKTVTVTAGQTLTDNFSMTKATAVQGPASSTTNGDSQYQVQTVNVGGTNYTVNLATFNLASGQFRVVTDTANDSDCLNNCPTKSLSSYVSDNGGFAGMNGTYFCPADYAACAGKTGSYYWKVWNSRLGKMINGDTNSFVYEPFLTVTNNTAKYYDSWSDFSGSTSAGISSSPALISGGRNVLDQGKLDDKQRTVKSNRGSVGLKGQTLYFVIAKSATVIDLAGIMNSLGVDYAMNLDGGGSSAMIFNGSYKVGPGRAIPNAIVVARR